MRARERGAPRAGTRLGAKATLRAVVAGCALPLGVGLLAGGCGDDAPRPSEVGRGDTATISEAIEATLFGSQAFRVASGHAAPIPCFTRARQPAFLVPEGLAAGASVLVSDGATTASTALTRVPTTDHSAVLRAHTTRRLEGPGRVEVRLEDGRTRSWPVEWYPALDDVPGLGEAKKLRRARQIEAARAALSKTDSSTSAWVRTFAAVERGHIDFVEGDRPRAELDYLRAAETASAAGFSSEVALRHSVVAFMQFDDGRLFEARAHSAKAQEIEAALGDEVGILERLNIAAQIEQRLGEYRRALELDRRLLGLARYDHPNMPEFVAMMATQLLDAGRYHEALAVFETARPQETPSETREIWLQNRAWVRLAAMQVGAIPVELGPIARAYDEGLAWFEAHGPPQRITSLLTDRAYVALLEGQLDEAQRLLDRVAAYPPEQNSTARWLVKLVQARVDLARGRFTRARALLQTVAGGAKRETGGRATEESTTARMLLGDVAEAEGKHDLAIATYEAALADARDLTRRFEVPVSRARYQLRSSDIGSSLARALLEKKRTAEAFAAVEQQRGSVDLELGAQTLSARHPSEWARYQKVRAALEARSFEGCDAVAPRARPACRDAIERARASTEEALSAFWAAVGFDPKTELPADRWIARLRQVLGPKDALLTLCELPSGGRTAEPRRARGRGEPAWFWLDRRGLATGRGQKDSDAWRARVKGVEHLYVSLDSRSAAADPALLTDDAGAPLLARTAVSFIPHAGFLLKPETDATRAPLLLLDPDGDLPRARQGGLALAERFPNADVLTGDRATRDSVLASWSGRQLLHFVGHAELYHQDPWSTRLVLTGGQSLDLDDLLTQRPAIRLAVLEGCTTGAVGWGIGLLQAMLISGTRSVLATTRPLEDGEAAAFLTRFYDAGGLERPGPAFRAAVAASIAAHDGVWSAFRLWGHP